MYIDIVPNRNSRPAVLLREGWREAGRIRKKTLANLTHWPEHKVEALRRVLRDEPVMAPEDVFVVERSLPHGHVEAVLGTVRKLELDRLVASRRCQERDLVVAMVVEQIIQPSSKLGTTRLWHASTLAEELGVSDADEDELYLAMDWLVERQSQVEKKLAARHLGEGSQALYDVSSSYYEGKRCPLVCFGFSRDGKRGKPIIVYGLLTNREGCPVSVQVYPGNTADPKTVPDQVEKLREQYELERVVLVGDRGLLTQTQIETLKQHPGLSWVSSLRSGAIRKLVNSGCLQLSLFDEKNLAEIHSEEFPGERLVACYNPLLAEERRRKRQALLEATEAELEKIRKEVGRRRRTPLGKAAIGMKVGRVLHHYKMGKHFEVKIDRGVFEYGRRQDQIDCESQLDGIYVIRTSEPEKQLSAEDTVRTYKQLTEVERAFRCLKSIELLVRPIRHREERRVRAHVFLCMLAYYVKWHMSKALAPLLFHDEDLEIDRRQRDPVAPAKPSASSKRKKAVGLTREGLPVHSFKTLLVELSTRCRNRCRLKTDPKGPTFDQVTEPTGLQRRAMELLGLFPVTERAS